MNSRPAKDRLVGYKKALSYYNIPVKDKYIFYRCPSSCKYLIKSRQSILKLYSKKELKEKGIYVGKELSELMNKINVSKEDKNMENVKTIVELFNTYLEIVEGNSPRL